MARHWLRQYFESGAMPGFQRFYSPLSAEYVYFPQLMEDVYYLLEMTKNHESVDWDGEDDENMDDMDLFTPLPVNIGRFGLGPTFRWFH